ncbi:MAG: hypothetical protein ACREEI_11755, partial [Stellaceae bacterium]
LTPQGTTTYQQIMPWLRAFQDDILSMLEPNERGALETMLVKLEQRSVAMAQTRAAADAAAH